MIPLVVIAAVALLILLAQSGGVNTPSACPGGSMNQSANSIGIPAVYQLAKGAGFSGSNLAIATAIAMAESGGDPNAYNPEKCACPPTPQGFGSYGLWQIYLYSHPEDAGQNLKDPATNAAAAFSIWSAHQSFMPWSTYKFSKYQTWMPEVNAYIQTLCAATAVPQCNPAVQCVQGQGQTGGSPNVPCITGGEG